MNNKKFNYFIDSLIRYNSNSSCPYCGSIKNKIVDRKYLVTRLFECSSCQLMFRHPKDKLDFNKKFYQDDYAEFGMTTNIPSDIEIQKLLSSNFDSSEKDFSENIKILKILKGPVVKIVDYGCSWGYSSSQFLTAGLSVQSYEISKKMALVGNKKLGLNIYTKDSQINPENDIFFTSHVIEHLSNINELFEIAKKLLLPDGLFIAYSPNGSKDYKIRKDSYFHSLWGMVHPNYLSSSFYKTVFKEHPYMLSSNPYNDLKAFSNWDQESQLELKLDGDELLFICKINSKRIFE